MVSVPRRSASGEIAQGQVIGVPDPTRFELDEKGQCAGAQKIKIFDDGREFVTEAWDV